MPGKAKIKIFNQWEKVGIFYFLATGSRFRLLYQHPLTWMIMQRLLPLKQISTHHFSSLDTCYNWILGCCHLKACNFGECWIFSTEVLTKKLKFFIFVLPLRGKCSKSNFWPWQNCWNILFFFHWLEKVEIHVFSPIKKSLNFPFLQIDPRTKLKVRSFLKLWTPCIFGRWWIQWTS